MPEARNRDLVAKMLVDFAITLQEHFRHPDLGAPRWTGPGARSEFRQVWLPNGSHLDMLHFLAYTYRSTRTGEPSSVERLNGLGRLAGWLFREAKRPGQVTVMDACEALRRSYIFPAESVRQAHLGFLLAWLRTRGNREQRLSAAAAAEQLSISTSLDPVLEREQLEPLVSRWNELGGRDDRRLGAKEARQIESILSAEIERRHSLTCEAIDVLRMDLRPVNPGCETLIMAGLSEQWYQYLRLEQQIDDPEDGPAFTPSPETDSDPSAAASRYFIQEASEQLRIGALIHHDAELQHAVVASGAGIRGEIIEVRDDSETGVTKPIWVLSLPDSGNLKVREGTSLCPVGVPSRTLVVRSIARDKNRVLVEVEITKLKSGQSGVIPAATDPTIEGQTVTLVPTSMNGLSRLKSQRVWSGDVAGGWVTHVRPTGSRGRLAAELESDKMDAEHSRARQP